MRLTEQSLYVMRALYSPEWLPDAALTGAEIIRRTGMPSGTVYPILKGLEKHNLASSKKEKGSPSKLGRPLQKHYRLTQTGQRRFESVRDALMERI